MIHVFLPVLRMKIKLFRSQKKSIKLINNNHEKWDWSGYPHPQPQPPDTFGLNM
jgi:hypothetical protein